MTIKAEQPTMESKLDQFVKRFVDETGVSPTSAAAIWHLYQASKLLREQEDFKDNEYRELDYAFNTVSQSLFFRRALDGAFKQIAEELGNG